MSDLDKEMLGRFAQLEYERAPIQEMWQAIERFVTPYRGKFFRDETSENSIEWTRRDIYDSTAVHAHQALSAAIHGALTSPAIKWFNLKFRDTDIEKDNEAVAWLQKVSDLVFYELQDSNFDLEINEQYQDLCGPGTSFLFLEESTPSAKSWEGLKFTSVPLKEAFFEEDHNGEVEYFYRKLEWTPVQMVSKFGDACPKNIKEQAQSADQNKQEVIFCIHPTKGVKAPLGGKQRVDRRPYRWSYILRSDATTLEEGGFYEMPVFAGRFRTTSGSRWGNSPAMIALGDILTLNHARKLQLVASEKMIDPPLFAEERSVLFDLDLRPGAFNVVRDLNGIKPFDTNGNIPVSDVIITQLQESIKDTFYTSQLQFPPTQGTPMSATEAQIRYEQLQKLLGPTQGRIQNDMLNPIVERTYRLLARKGMLPPVPEVVKELQPDFDVVYLGALSRAQSVDNAAAVERWASMLVNMGQALPDLLDTIDPIGVSQSLGKDLHVPAACYRDEAEVKKVRQEREAMQQRMAEATVQQEEQAANEGP